MEENQKAAQALWMHSRAITDVAGDMMLDQDLPRTLYVQWIDKVRDLANEMRDEAQKLSRDSS